MAAPLRAVFLAALVATTATADTVKSDGEFCNTKFYGIMTDEPAPIVTETLRRNIYDHYLRTSNPCPMGKVGLKVTVCDPDAPPTVTIISVDQLQVHRPQPIHDATAFGYIYCR